MERAAQATVAEEVKAGVRTGSVSRVAWSISSDVLRCLPKGDSIESNVFKLDNLQCPFSIIYWPKGVVGKRAMCAVAVSTIKHGVPIPPGYLRLTLNGAAALIYSPEDLIS